MPYQSTSELPQPVKDKYSEKCQRAFMHAFNSVHEKTNDEGRASAAGHSAAQQCEGKKDMTDTMTLPSAEFRFFSGILKAGMGEDGTRKLTGVASSTTRDMHGDVMTLSAIEDMERAANNNLTIFLNHSYNVPEDVGGSVKSARVMQRGTDADGAPNYDLDFDIAINESNPRALQTFEAIQRGTKLGLSIGAVIPDGGATVDRKTGRYTISHVDLLETSLVGIPANPRSWVDYAVKALRNTEIPAWDSNTITTNSANGEWVVEIAPIEPQVTETEPLDEEAVVKALEEEERQDEDSDSSQEAEGSEPEIEDLIEDETSEDDSEALGDEVTLGLPDLTKTLDLLRQMTADLVTVRAELADTREALASAERERDEAVQRSAKVLASAQQVLDRLAEIPLARRTQYVEARRDFYSRMAGLYPEGFLKMMEERGGSDH